MKLDTRALAIAAGLLWGGAILLVGIINMMSADYGVAFLSTVASVYPGFEPFTGIGSLVIGSVYGLVDGAIGGFIFAWLYNLIAKRA